MADTQGKLDLLSQPPQEERPKIIREIPPYSSEWAEVVQPVALSLLGLIATVMLLPFLIVVCVEEKTGRQVLDWAKTVLPPVVGFGGALIGYYFGTRGNQQEPSSEE